MLAVFCFPARDAQGRDAKRSLGGERARPGLSGKALVIARRG